jgi:cytochrome c-type biogenesis protein CcmH
MSLLLALTLMVAIAVAGVTVPLIRNRERKRRPTTLDVLKAQLADVESQRDSGQISAEDAHGLSTEIKRRIIAEGRVNEGTARPLDGHVLPYIAAGLAVLVASSAALLYMRVGRPDLAAAANFVENDASATPQPGGFRDLPGIIEKLKARLAQSPNETQGWRLLGWAYLVTGKPSDAANAYARAIALDPRVAADHSAQGDALVQAAGGQVTPAALAAFHDATARDPNDARARYFLALFKEQQGDHEGAMADWIALLKSAPPDAPWLADVRAFVERVARTHGQDLSKLLSGVATDTQNAPSAAQAGPVDPSRMIHAMVDKLAAELKANPRNQESWTELMRARMVLGETDAAKAAYRDAMSAFADAPSKQAELHHAAQALHVPGA